MRAHRLSAYDFELVAIVHPSVTKARAKFEWLTAHGMPWRVLERPLPINVSAIPNKMYRERLPKSGCCGEKELLKLWAFSLTEYHRVLHLDMDSLILNSMDELFEDPMDCLYTEDWLMASKVLLLKTNSQCPHLLPRSFRTSTLLSHEILDSKGTKVAPAQGGFLLLRPSLDLFSELQAIVQEGDWRGGAGWGGSGIGFFYGEQETVPTSAFRTSLTF